MTTITVIIPVWNRAQTVGRAIDSAISQCVPADWSVRILVVDDGSHDGLAEAIRAYGHRVQCVVHAANRGAAAARNTGIAAADGDYVAFLDSDDIWLPGKLATQIAFMRSGHYAASCTAYALARPTRHEIISPRHATGALGVSELVWGCFVSPGATLVCARTVFDEIGPLETSLQRFEDWDTIRTLRRFSPLLPLCVPDICLV
jgi:glycosyltransferase involved in cell wall biosynthesis